MSRRTEDPDAPWHGTLGGYNNHRCRCWRCKQANAAYQAAYRRRHPERSAATGKLMRDMGVDEGGFDHK